MSYGRASQLCGWHLPCPGVPCHPAARLGLLGVESPGDQACTGCLPAAADYCFTRGWGRGDLDPPATSVEWPDTHTPVLVSPTRGGGGGGSSAGFGSGGDGSLCPPLDGSAQVAVRGGSVSALSSSRGRQSHPSISLSVATTSVGASWRYILSSGAWAVSQQWVANVGVFAVVGDSLPSRPATAA